MGRETSLFRCPPEVQIAMDNALWGESSSTIRCVGVLGAWVRYEPKFFGSVENLAFEQRQLRTGDRLEKLACAKRYVWYTTLRKTPANYVSVYWNTISGVWLLYGDGMKGTRNGLSSPEQVLSEVDLFLKKRWALL